jgi:hypothetical protein
MDATRRGGAVTRPVWRHALAALVAVVLVAAGCGGEPEERPAATQTTTPGTTPATTPGTTTGTTTTPPAAPGTTSVERPPRRDAAAPRLVAAEPWKRQAAPMAWAGGRIYFNSKRRGTDVFEGWSAKPDGSDVRLVTGSRYPAGTQHGVSDVTADGRHVLLTIERPDHWPIPDGATVAVPGAGAYNDLWLQTADGSQAWKLRDLLDANVNALIWARFDADGRRVVWSEQWKFGLPWGDWQMHVADLVWRGGEPSLEITATLRTKGLLEAYGFTHDGDRILFAADALAGTSWDNLQIMSLPASLKGKATRLSARDAPDEGSFSNHNEFAYSMPGRDRILYARSVGAHYFSLEYWTAKPDGSDARQLTSFSDPSSRWYDGYPSIAGGLAFNPDDPDQFVAGFATNYEHDFKSFLITVE